MRSVLHAAIAAALITWHGADVWLRVRGPRDLGPPTVHRPSGLVPMERKGSGVSCGTAEGVRGCEVRGSSRRMLVGLPLDPGRADLEVLPGIGRVLAARIAARARADPGTIVDRRILASIRGVGPRRAAEIATALGLDGPPFHDICSMGSWPTTSSGCDKPR